MKYRPSYNIAGVNNVCTILKNNDLTAVELSAISRAYLRYQIAIDNEHQSVRRKGGLHPYYIALHSTGEKKKAERPEIAKLLKDTYDDILDAVSHRHYILSVSLQYSS
jgi:hypothetical protein